MEKKIRTKEDYYNKLSEIGDILGFKIDYQGNDVYITIKDKKVKMNNNGNYYYVNDGINKICFKGFFFEHTFSTSALIEFYITNGNDRMACRFDQELKPSSGTGTLPRFTITSYSNGKLNTFFSNGHQVETIEADTADNLLINKMREYEDLQFIYPLRQTDKKLTRFLFGVEEQLVGKLTPITYLDIVKNAKRHSYQFYNSLTIFNYNEWTCSYKHSPKDYDLMAFIPFLSKVKEKSVKQLWSKSIDFEKPFPKDFMNLMILIVRNDESITTFNNVINYFENSRAWLYISKHYLDLINFTRNAQNGIIVDDLNIDISEDEESKILK